MEQWFLEPLFTMRTHTNGNSFFIELLVACVLYERYCSARYDSGKQDKIIAHIQADFDTTEDAATAFWYLVRNGLAHQAMPLQRTRGVPENVSWFMHDSFPDRYAMRMYKDSGENVLSLQPRVIADRVIELWRNSPELIKKSKAFPWPKNN